MVVHNLELADVAVLHHDGQEFDDDLAARPDQDLALSALLGVVDCPQCIVEHADEHHDGPEHAVP
eukprot:m.429101 g.429101  ORF g.429101 m.429101 type:complete len:65 (+) comp16957_c0_seq1:289-483(+)